MLFLKLKLTALVLEEFPISFVIDHAKFSYTVKGDMYERIGLHCVLVLLCLTGFV